MSANGFSFKNWSVKAKLIGLFAMFGLVPIIAIGSLAIQASSDMKDKVGQRFQDTASSVSEQIDRNLFERYGDVQAFTYNDVVTRMTNWGDTSDTNAISQVMNKYVAAYGIYYLTMLVDTRGDLIAVNYTDAAGQPIDASALWKKNYQDTPWFQALEADQYTTKMPFTAEGNDISTGTFIEDVHIDPIVKAAYPDDDAMTMGFSSRVYDGEGQLVGYWSNRAKFSLVEEIFQKTYQELSGAGFPGAELTLLGSKGQVLIDFDPITQGSEQINRDLENTIFKLNLAEKGVQSAQRVVAGESGFLTANHARKQIDQVGGFAHLDGALGYPGMNWSVLVRIPESEASAEATAIQTSVLVAALACLLLMSPIAWYVGRKGDQQMEAIKESEMKLDAAGKAQAVIEFDNTGNILTANDNFLNTLGYSLPEIQGQHHRMFCDPAYTGTSEYTAFWEKLNRGEYDAGLYCRIGKGGKEVWIQASYNPIKDAKGHVYKVVKFATDVTKDRNQAAEFEGKIEAVSKAQAVIEFNLDGTIIIANDNFLNTLGYSMSEIQGKHHRMFCDPAYTGTSEYAAFWEKLNRGEFDAGVYRRVGNGGKEIWIQASYNPIFDANGVPYKVVKYATDITAQKTAQAQLEAMMAEAQKVLGAMAQGDLREKMTGAYEGDLDKMKESINLAIENLTKTVTNVLEGAANVESAAGEISQGNDDLSQRTSDQASSLEETSASMEEMTSTVKQNADNAKQANQLAIAAREVAEKGGKVTSDAVEAMDEINKSSKKIADIINVIDEIAFQTNLLALNAAVEAARAGEQGRGFAVVATEVRNLAQRSAGAAKEIKDLINESVQKVGDGSELVNQSGKTLDEIVSSVKRVTDIISEITAASQEQSSGIDQVNKAIMQMDQTTQQNAALVEEAASSAQSMQHQAASLQREVDFFKTSGNSGAGASAPRQSDAPAKSVAPAARKSNPAPASRETSEPAGVGSGNGSARAARSTDDFEEF